MGKTIIHDNTTKFVVDEREMYTKISVNHKELSWRKQQQFSNTSPEILIQPTLQFLQIK